MKAEDLFENMDAIDDEILERSEQLQSSGEFSGSGDAPDMSAAGPLQSAGGQDAAGSKSSGRRIEWLRRIAAAAAVVAVVGAAVWMFGRGIFRGSDKPEKNETTTTVTGTVTVTPGDGKQGGVVDEEEVSEWEKYLAKYRVAKADSPKATKMPDLEDYKDGQGNYRYDAYEEACRKWRSVDTAYVRSISASQRTSALNGVVSFAQSGLAQLLSGETGTNRVCSPANLYMAFAMLAEVTGGDTRAQIMQLLGVNDIDRLREMADTAWKLLYRDNGLTTSVPASSLWLRDDDQWKYISDTISRVAETYHASTFHGTMGSAEYDQAFQAWLNEQTGGLLSDSVKNQTFDELTVLTIATTLHFTAKWHEAYKTGETCKQVFHAQSGDIESDFMHKSMWFGTYYAGDWFAAVYDTFDGDYRDAHMIFFLPDEGVSVEELLSDPQVFALLGGEQEIPEHKTMRINLAVPKFDITSDMELSDNLKKLGVTDVFDMETADFSALAENPHGIYLSKVDHSVRVKIDEEGVEAAAYTVLPAVGASMPPEEETDFVLDRPFLFAICAEGWTPLFVGIVENP